MEFCWPCAGAARADGGNRSIFLFRKAWLERWIANYVSADPKPSPEVKAHYPLREAKVEVREVPGAPGSYNAVAWLRPWLQMEELTTSLRMVARIPQLQK